MSDPFRYFNSSSEVIRLVVMMYVKYPLSLRNVEDLLAERGIDISHETVRFWWNRFGPMFAAEIRKKRVAHMRGYPQWRWHLDEAFVKVNGKLCYLWRAVDHEGEVLELVVTAKRDKAAALKFLKRIMKKYGRPRTVVTDGLCSYPSDKALMTPQHLTRRLAARKLAADRLAIDLILDCERAASGRNGKRADPARWTEETPTDWRCYLRAAARSPATSRLAPLYHAIGDIEAALCER